MEPPASATASPSAILIFPVLRARLRPDERGEARAAIVRLRERPRPPFAGPRRPRPAA